MAYAGKAFLCLAMARLVAEEGLHLDVASAGELHTAVTAGVPPARLVMHGNNKSPVELAMALDSGVGRIVVDNLPELGLLGGLVARRPGRRPAEILIRVAPGVDPHTHRRIRTGQGDTKFGLSLAAGQAMEAVLQAVGTPHLLFTGLHAHVGSNLPCARRAQVQALETILDFAVQVREETGLTLENLNLGGAWASASSPRDEITPGGLRRGDHNRPAGGPGPAPPPCAPDAGARAGDRGRGRGDAVFRGHGEGGSN